MPYETIIVERDGPLAILRLNRPEKRNAVNRQMSLELAQALDELAAEEGVLALVLTGSGDRAFCAGADMGEAVAEQERGAYRSPDEAGNPYGKLLHFPKPAIAAVNGYAFGGGAVLAINCDIRVAAEVASFRFVGATYGLVVGASQLPRVVGAAKAKELIFTARVVSAQEALSIGLVNQVVPPSELMETVLGMARAIAANSPAAVRLSKEVIEAATFVPGAAERERQANRVLRAGAEHRQRFRQAAARVTGSETPSEGTALPGAPKA